MSHANAQIEAMALRMRQEEEAMLAAQQAELQARRAETQATILRAESDAIDAARQKIMALQRELLQASEEINKNAPSNDDVVDEFGEMEDGAEFFNIPRVSDVKNEATQLAAEIEAMKAHLELAAKQNHDAQVLQKASGPKDGSDAPKIEDE